jgi:propanediol dehydratase small subunit
MSDDEPTTDLGAIYPVGEKQPERARTRRGRSLADLTLDNVLSGQVTAADFGITAEGLRLQANIAERAGRKALAHNLRRGAELVEIPDDELFEIYELLRPGRAQSAADLLAAAERLRRNYAAEETARLLEEAAAAYERRGLLGRRR